MPSRPFLFPNAYLLSVFSSFDRWIAFVMDVVRSNKRAAEAEDDASNSRQRLEAGSLASTSSTALATPSSDSDTLSLPSLSSLESISKLQWWGQRLRGDVGSLTKLEVDDLSSTIEAACETFLLQLSRTDLLNILERRYLQPASPSGSNTSIKIKPFPTDVIALIIDEWRRLFEGTPMKNLRSEEHQSWVELSRLAVRDCFVLPHQNCSFANSSLSDRR